MPLTRESAAELAWSGMLLAFGSDRIEQLEREAAGAAARRAAAAAAQAATARSTAGAASAS